MIKTKLITGKYFDSVSLMLVARSARGEKDVLDAALVMGTDANKKILEAAGFLVPEVQNASESDVIIAVKATSAERAEEMISQIIARLESKKTVAANGKETVKSIASAMKKDPSPNLALISVAGRYAATLAYKAIEANLNVMLFSDNVSLSDEISLKRAAHEKGLLCMGPDCGTAIINGVPLAFANAVKKGNIGLVGASGTGLQEITSIISNNGGGISSALGTGGRDLKKEVGGIMFQDAIDFLEADEGTEVIVLVSKTPDAAVLQKLKEQLKKLKKPIIAHFIGASAEVMQDLGVIEAKSLEDAALLAVTLVKHESIDKHRFTQEQKYAELNSEAREMASMLKPGQKYLRGLFCGGTLAQETLFELEQNIDGKEIFANLATKHSNKLADPTVSTGHTILDLGDDEFTVGRPHPMIDPSLRNARLLKEATEKDVAVIIFDLVIGYGSNPDPLPELLTVLKNARDTNTQLRQSPLFIASVTGTDLDPQNRSAICDALSKNGVKIMPSNASAAKLAVKVLKNREGI